MEEGFNVQKKFFNELKAKLPFNLSLANVVADELSISIDSAYRRIRGESDLSLKEFNLLSSKFSVPTDIVFSKSQNYASFKYRSIQCNHYDLKSYFNSIAEEIKLLEHFGIKEIIYSALDLPIFYYFIFPKLAAFKIFFWKRSVFEFPKLNDLHFNFNIIDDNDLERSHNMLKNYLAIPNITEVWSEDTINATLRQIRFYNEIEIFESKQDIIYILDDLKKVLNHIEKQAEFGYKFYPGTDFPINSDKNNFKLYFNKLTLSENMILLKSKYTNKVHLGYNVLNILTTNDEEFFNDAHEFYQKIIKNSTLLSVISERERQRFFKILSNKIDALINNL